MNTIRRNVAWSVARWPIAIAVSAVVCRGSVHARADTLITTGNQSPAINAQTVTISYSSAGVEIEQITAQGAKIDAIAPTLTAYLDARLNKLFAEQRRNGSSMDAIRSVLEDEIKKQLTDVQRRLEAISPERLAAELREALFFSSVDLTATVEIAADDRCAKEPNCVLLSATPSGGVTIKIEGTNYSNSQNGILDIDGVVARCEDVSGPERTVAVPILSEAPSDHEWLHAVSVRRSGERNAKLHAVLSFVPKRRCRPLEVTVYVVSSSGAIHAQTQTIVVKAPTLTLWDRSDQQHQQPYAPGPGTSHPNVLGHVTWALEERRLLPFVPLRTSTDLFTGEKNGIFTIDGASIVAAGRDLATQLDLLPPPAPLSDERYKDMLRGEAWDAWGYDLLEHSNIRETHLSGQVEVCERLMNAMASAIGETVTVDQWLEHCNKAAVVTMDELLSKGVSPTQVRLSFDKQYTSSALWIPSASGDLSDSNHSTGWETGPLSTIQPRLPVRRRVEDLYIAGDSEEVKPAKLEVVTYGQPDLWVQTRLGVGYAPNASFSWLNGIAFPVFFDLLELEAYGGNYTDGGFGGAVGAKFSLLDYGTMVMGADGLPLRRVSAQVGVGVEGYFDRPGRVFVDGFLGWTLPIAEKTLTRTRIGIDWRPGGVSNQGLLTLVLALGV